jgi:dihydrofolate reductase
MEIGMRKLIAAFKTSVDGKIEGPEGYADWVEAWSEDYGLTQHIDACVLGGGMYLGYEQYWTTIQKEPNKLHPLSNKLPTRGEAEWARFAEQTPHYVLSRTLTSALWPKTRFLTKLEDIAALKRQPGKDIYLMGGARIAATLIDAGLVDELRLIVYPLIVGEGKPLFDTALRRHRLELRKARELPDRRMSLIYGLV